MGVIAQAEVICDADRARLWTALTNTERLNRAAGMGPITVSPLEGGGAARYLARTVIGGFGVEYEERPFEWTYLKDYRVHRVVRSGPVKSIDFRLGLEDAPGGHTRVSVRLDLEPRRRWLSPFIGSRARRQIKRFEEEIRGIDRAIIDGIALGRGAAQHRAVELERALASLSSSVSAELVQRFGDLVRSGEDVDLSRIRPYQLAETWDRSRPEVLSGCLSAVSAGLFDLRWNIVCPSCRTASDSLPSLSELTSHGSCLLCELEFDVDLDEAVEATFAVSRAIRAVDAGPYCIGGPAITPHVLAQAILPASGSATMEAPSEPGAYRIFVRGGKKTTLVVAEGGAATVALDSLLAEPIDAVGPSASVVIRNVGADERHVKLERLTWPSLAATAREVTALPAFRREFSADTLRPGLALRVSRVAIFFSDLTGSTALYSLLGDATAFRMVQDHFEVLFAIIEQHGGVVVKTIGDAVMCAFADELDGVRASLAILAAFEEFRARTPVNAQTAIKLGLYSGSCYAVTANGALDYFGQVVNIAARLQGEAHSGQLVVADELFERASASGLLSEAMVLERYDAALKGVQSRISAVRVGATG